MSRDYYHGGYTRRGRVVHLIAPSYIGGGSVCGRAPLWPEDWRGTGSQSEYEKAEALPLCKDCERRTRRTGEAS